MRLPADYRIPVRILCVGTGLDAMDDLIEAIDRGGRDRGLHFEKQAVHFRLDETKQQRRFSRLTQEELLATTGLKAKLPSLEIQLTAPLRLKRRGQFTVEPTLSDILAASIRIVSQLMNQTGEPIRFDSVLLKRQADRVICVENHLKPFQRSILAKAGKQRHGFNGVVGRARYADVPLSLVPWLVWGGRLHVGDRRAAGAGGWRVVLS